VTINRVMIDNGSGYRLTAGYSLGVKPYTPRTNGMAEQVIQTNLIEWTYKQAYESSAEWRAAWLYDYNHRRRTHAHLNNRPSISRGANCEQPP
jgi:transposase InsO family protein